MGILAALVAIVATLIVVVILGLVVFAVRTARRVEKALPPSGKFMEIEGERVHYVDSGGAGPAIVMIHGLGGNLMQFTYALAGRLEADFRVIVVDRPGYGYSERPEGKPVDLTAQAATLAKFMRGLGLKRPLLVGHSLGGALSLAIALDHPGCAGALALISPMTRMPDDVPDVFKGLIINSPALRKAIAWTMATPFGIRNGPAVLKELFAPEPVPEDLPIRAGGILGLRPKEFWAASTDASMGASVLPKYVARYPSLALPIGMLFGTGDRLLDYRTQGEAMKAVCPTLELELTEGGHMLLITAPDRCAALIRRVATRQREVERVA